MIYVFTILLLIFIGWFFLPVLVPAAIITYLLWRLLASDDAASDKTQEENQNKP